MSVLLLTHSACLAHDTGPFHPECPDRLRHVMAALEAESFADLLREAAPLATEEALLRVHSPLYVRSLLALSPLPDEPIPLDPDTVFSAGSAEAALRAAGAGVAAVDAVMSGSVRATFAAVRPPGHHAEPDRAMGFCLFSNAAIAARHAQARWGAARVAVLDFDVHHGNGTQAVAADDPSLFYGSTHQHPCYPGTGSAAEHGVAGNVVNVPLAPGTGSAEFRDAWAGSILPALHAWGPDLIVVSAGFDAHRADPLAQLRLETNDFAWITAAIDEVARARCSGRLVSMLEGGYDLRALAAATAAHVRTLMLG